MILARTRASSANVLSSRAISAAASSRAPLTIGIRREDPGRIWERRCPLTPEAVHDLVHKEGVRVLVQDCDRRVFTVDEFRAVSVVTLS
jgi:alpha-aminoadipic semialdehyde synthase